MLRQHAVALLMVSLYYAYGLHVVPTAPPGYKECADDLLGTPDPSPFVDGTNDSVRMSCGKHLAHRICKACPQWNESETGCSDGKVRDVSLVMSVMPNRVHGVCCNAPGCTDLFIQDRMCRNETYA